MCVRGGGRTNSAPADVGQLGPFRDGFKSWDGVRGSLGDPACATVLDNIGKSPTYCLQAGVEQTTSKFKKLASEGRAAVATISDPVTRAAAEKALEVAEKKAYAAEREVCSSVLSLRSFNLYPLAYQHHGLAPL